jgi:hypothetical protein
MPSKSKSQQRIMALALQVKQGDMTKSDFDDINFYNKLKKIADNISEKDLTDYAETSHKGKPEKVKEEDYTINDVIKIMVNEELSILLKENISIKNNLDSIEILFLKKINQQKKIKDITNLLKKYVSISNISKTNNSIKFDFKETLSTSKFIMFIMDIKNKLKLNIKRQNKNIYIIGLE